MTTELAFACYAALLAVALWRRPQAITVVLAGAFLVAVAVGYVWPADTRLPVVIAIDAAVVVAMAHLARKHRSDRAGMVMGIGAAKIAFAICAAAVGLYQPTRAATLNAAFVAQVLIAGGLLDGVIAWLGHRVRRVGDRAHGMLGRLGGW